MKKNKVLYCIIGAVVGLAMFTLLFVVMKRKDSIYEVNYKKSEAEVRNIVSTKLANGVRSFSDICYAMYAGTIGDVELTQSTFGKKTDLLVEEKVDRCIGYALGTGHNIFSCVKKGSIDDIERICSCFIKESEIDGIMVKVDEVVCEVLDDKGVKRKTISSVKSILSSKINADNRIISLEESNIDDDWERTVTDIASFVGKAAVKMLF